MAKKINKNRVEAFEIYRKHKGNITNRAIAEILNVNEKTVSVWKYRDLWKAKIEDENCSIEQEKGATTARAKQKRKITQSLKTANTYSTALEPLIEVYLDCWQEYQNAIAENLETEKLRKELAKLLAHLGLNAQNRNMFQNDIKKRTKNK